MTADRVWRWRWRLVAAVLVAAAAVWLVQGANRPADPVLQSPPGEQRPLTDFPDAAFTVTSSGGETGDWCALLADDADSRAQGLMDQADLGGYDGMLFVYDEPVDGTFHMRDTLIPLSIAFFDGSGRFVNAADMDPCPDEVDDCPSYGAAGPFATALEVAQGDLDDLGIGEGAVLTVPGSGCSA